MKTRLQNLLNASAKVAGFILGTGASIFLFGAVTATAAQADVACGAIQCSVGSQQNAGGSDGGGSGNGGGNTGGGSGPSKYTSEFLKCAGWEGAGAEGQFEHSYPAPPSTSNCYWGLSALRCPPSNGISSYGRFDVYLKNEDGSRGDLTYWYCAYPQPQYVMPSTTTFTRPLGGAGDFYLSNSAGNASVYGASGTLSDATGYRSTGFDSSNPYASLSLNQQFNAFTLVRNQQPVYGYYRLQWRIDWTEWSRTSWPSFVGKADEFKHLRNFQTTQANPYTYACNTNPALAAGVNPGAKFTPADCLDTSWQCDIRGEITHLGTTNSIIVMRNGEHIPVGFPSFGVTGNGVKDVRNQQTNTYVDMMKVSPVNGSDPNGSKQYFESNWRWNSWETYSPSTPKWIAFYWSSDNGQSFRYDQKYKFTADFYVPTQGSIDGGTAFKWVPDTTECDTVKASANINVVRSAGSN